MKKIGLLLLFVLFYTANIIAQATFSGKVQDKDGNPLVGATVKSKTDVSKTNETGSFSVKAKAGETLYISFVGMDLKTVKAAEAMAVQMTIASKSETEVIVTGYTTRSKRANTGSASTVTIDDIRSQPIASFDQLLQGQAPGLKAISNSGQPGAAAQVIIRGRGSSAASVNPLYILDGMEITPQDFATLNQGDFESVTVLKDAVTAGIYGSRGSNGVIVITTRRGKAGTTKFNYDFQIGQSKFPRNKLKLMNTQEKLDYEKVNGNPNGWTPSEFDSLYKINTDWEDVFFRTGQTQSHQLSASGGSDRTRFYTSLSYLNQTGTVQATALKRYTVRLNLESGTEKVKFGINTSVGYSEFTNTTENNQGIGSPLNSIRWTLPYFTPKDAKGNYVVDPTGSAQPNALRELLENKREFPQLKAIGNVFGEYNLPIKGLSVRATLGIDYRNDQTTQFSPSTTFIGALAPGGKGSLFKANSNAYRITNTNSLNYKKSINRIHDITVMVAQEYILRKSNGFNYTGYGFTEPYFQNAAGLTPGNSTNGFIPLVGGGGTERRINSYFADAGYSYKNKIFANFNVRKDVSSALAASNKSALLGGIGAGWILSEENFLKNVKFINFFKVKASYGSTGNQEILGDFVSISTIGKTSYNGQNGYSVNTLPNPFLTWETRTTVNFGVDFALWKNRIKGGVEYYNSITKGLYNFEKVQATSGFTTRLSNNGKLRNRGIELNLSVNLLNYKAFSWTVNGNFTYNKNQVLELPDGQKETQDANGLTVTKIGSPLLSFKVNEYLGVDPATGNSIYRNASGGKTTAYTPSDAIVFGTSDAPYFGGITNTFQYKGLQLSIFWTYAFGNEIYNNDRVNVENPSYIASSVSRDLLREWRQPGDITDIPSTKFDKFESQTTRYLENGSFWRLRNVELAYNLPQSWMNKVKLGSVRIFVQGQNMVTITKFRGFDPEITNPSLGGAQYPTLKSLTAGLNIGF